MSEKGTQVFFDAYLVNRKGTGKKEQQKEQKKEQKKGQHLKKHKPPEKKDVEEKCQKKAMCQRKKDFDTRCTKKRDDLCWNQTNNGHKDIDNQKQIGACAQDLQPKGHKVLRVTGDLI